MIIVTRLNGQEFALNPDLIERADSTPDTVVTLVDGTKYLVAEPLVEVARLIREYRALVIAEAQRAVAPTNTPTLSAVDDPAPPPVVPLHRRER
ncbi:flagellar FlbD family protein [Cryptosporangium sp. NPDC051539]|uniref:flagellar FlbD family protein n=1 Tax=Cryptosporangium sp. NPDC051539 TaxID=3363962 RepID=UPI00378E90DF